MGADRSEDTLFDGHVLVAQPARGKGYRVNVDALILAGFAAGTLVGTGSGRERVARAAFDLGAGVGAVSLSLLHFGATSHATMVEIDPTLAAFADANAASNGWSEQVVVLRADVAHLEALPAGAADLVVCNPPYVEPGRGRPAAPARAQARSGKLSSFLDAARRLAGRRARVCFVYPARELLTLLAELRARGLEPKRMRSVHAKSETQARVVLVEACAGRPGGLVMEPPLLEDRTPLFTE